MAKVEIVKEKQQITFGNDNIVIAKYFSGIKGGRALNVEGYTEKNILAGQVIIKLENGEYAPLGVAGGKYTALPEGASYAGILTHSMDKNCGASIMTNGEVNKVAMPYQLTTAGAEGAEVSFEAAFAKALPHIVFIEDEED